MYHAEDDSKKRRDRARNREVVKKAILKVEQKKPMKEWGPRELKQEIGSFLSYRRILSHLKSLEKSRYVTRMQRGQYLSKGSLFWKKAFHYFIIHDVQETVPRLQGKAFDNLVSKSLTMITSIKEKERGKNLVHFLALRFKDRLEGKANKWKDVQNLGNFIYQDATTRTLDELDFIEDHTEITVLGSKANPFLDVEKLRETIAEILCLMVRYERLSNIPTEDYIGVSENPERLSSLQRKYEQIMKDPHTLDECSLNILVTFDPKKTVAPKITLRGLRS